MMVSPESYKKKKESQPLEQLVLDRTKLFNAIVEYEKKHIIDNEPFNYDEIAKPSAKDIYNMYNLYLKEITDLIITKSKQKKYEDYMYKVANDATNKDLLDSLLYPEDSHFEFYKKNDSDKIWWVNNKEQIGEHLFTFDKVKIYNLFRDYPKELTEEQKEVFDKENPYWSDYFKDRD